MDEAELTLWPKSEEKKKLDGGDFSTYLALHQKAKTKTAVEEAAMCLLCLYRTH
jgi:hypothetical protein